VFWGRIRPSNTNCSRFGLVLATNLLELGVKQGREWDSDAEAGCFRNSGVAGWGSDFSLLLILISYQFPTPLYSSFIVPVYH